MSRPRILKKLIFLRSRKISMFLQFLYLNLVPFATVNPGHLHVALDSKPSVLIGCIPGFFKLNGSVKYKYYFFSVFPVKAFEDWKLRPISLNPVLIQCCFTENGPVNCVFLGGFWAKKREFSYKKSKRKQIGSGQYRSLIVEFYGRLRKIRENKSGECLCQELIL